MRSVRLAPPRCEWPGCNRPAGRRVLDDDESVIGNYCADHADDVMLNISSQRMWPAS
jgi:hypothetical protein